MTTGKPKKTSGAAKKRVPAKQVASTGAEAMRQMATMLRKLASAPAAQKEAFLAGFGDPLQRMRPLSPQEEAQNLADQAMDAPTKAKALALTRRALVKDPDCVDALVNLAALASKTPEQAVAQLQIAVVAGERSLGTKYFKQNKGHFWGLIETRPYMRARHRLADMLLDMGRTADAVGHFEAMLDLNPNDNQGIREVLLGSYLSTENLDGARRILTIYREDAGALFSWGRLLERLLAHDFAAAEGLLVKARASNRFMELYLTGQRKLPRKVPEYYSLGSEEEAYFCFETLSDAWISHQETLFWLFAHCNLPLPATGNLFNSGPIQ